MIPKVYIVLLNYKIWLDTIECLESLFRLNYANFKVIVVDNPSAGASNNSLAQIIHWANNSYKFDYQRVPSSLQALFLSELKKPISYQYYSEEAIDKQQLEADEKSLILIQASENRGFSAGNNLGLKYILAQNDFDYVWILNNDTVVASNSLQYLVETYERSKTTKLGILGAKVRYYHQPEIIQCAAGAVYNKWLAHGRQIGTGQRDIGQYDHNNFRYDLIIGACMFINKEFLQDIGLLEEQYFLYFEEQDWAERAKRKGYHLGYTHQAVIYHKEGSTVGGNQLNIKDISELSDFYYARSKILFTKKFHHLLCLITVYSSFLLIIFNRIRRKQFKRIFMLIKIMISPNRRYENN